MKSVRKVQHKLRTRLAGHSTAGQPPPAPSAETNKQLAALRHRIEQLESEVQENRRLNRRLAELTDVVQELLVPIAQRDEDKLRERLEKYSESL